MKNTNLSAIKGAIIAVAIATAFLHVTASAQGDPPDRSLEGVWMVSITPRNCDTGDPIPVAMPLRQIWTFHGDKTILSSFGTNVLALSRTAAHGVWERRQGWSHMRTNSSIFAKTVQRSSLGGNRNRRAAYHWVPTVTSFPRQAPRSFSVSTIFRERQAARLPQGRGSRWISNTRDARLLRELGST